MKRKIPFLHILFSAVLFWLSAWSFACNPAQGSGQCGYYDQYGRYQNTAIGSYVIPPPAPSIGYGHSPTSPSSHSTILPRKYDRFGAIAYSYSDNVYSTSQDKLSRIDAEREALQKCNASDCKVIYTYHNSCMSVSAGEDKDKEIVFIANSSVISQDVRNKTLTDCTNDGYKKCREVVHECSLPH